MNNEQMIVELSNIFSRRNGVISPGEVLKRERQKESIRRILNGTEPQHSSKKSSGCYRSSYKSMTARESFNRARQKERIKALLTD